MHISVILSVLLAWTVQAFYAARDDVIVLTDKNFETKVNESELPIMVEFYAPWCGHCKNLKPDYLSAAASAKGIVRFGAIDCDNQSNQAICSQYQIRGFPTLKLIQWDKKERKRRTREYQGPRTAGAMVAFGKQWLHSYAFSIASDKLDKFSSLSDNPKFLLFVDRDDPEKFFDALTVVFKGKADFGFVKKTERALAERFKVTSFPTLLGFKSGTLADDPAVFEGPFKQEPVAKFVKDLCGGPGTKPSGGSKQESADELLVLNKVDTRADLERFCLSQPGLCIISFIVLEEEYKESVSAFKESTAILDGVMAVLKGRPHRYNFVWVNPIHNRKMINQFGIADNFPGMLLLNPRKKVFRNLTSYFDKDAILKFLDDSVSGIGRFFTYTDDPIIEGKAAEQPAKDKEEL